MHFSFSFAFFSANIYRQPSELHANMLANRIKIYFSDFSYLLFVYLMFQSKLMFVENSEITQIEKIQASMNTFSQKEYIYHGNSYGEDENCTESVQSSHQMMLQESLMKYFQTIGYLLIYFIGTIGNLLVIYVILVNRKLKTVTNFYLLNLALADLMYLQVIPFSITTMMKQKWVFNRLICKLFWTCTGINQFTGVFILTVLAFDRYNSLKITLINLRIHFLFFFY